MDGGGIWMQVCEYLGEFAAEQGRRLGPIHVDTAFGSDLGLSSFDVINIMIGLEERFKVHLSFEQLAKLPGGEYRTDLTVGELVSYLGSRERQEF